MHSENNNDVSKKSNNRNENNKEAENTGAAYEEAQKDIEQDPDLNPNDDPAKDLDEGELARLEGEP